MECICKLFRNIKGAFETLVYQNSLFVKARSPQRSTHALTDRTSPRRWTPRKGALGGDGDALCMIASVAPSHDWFYLLLVAGEGVGRYTNVCRRFFMWLGCSKVSVAPCGLSNAPGTASSGFSHGTVALYVRSGRGSAEFRGYLVWCDERGMGVNVLGEIRFCGDVWWAKIIIGRVGISFQVFLCGLHFVK